jgi:uncharacterized protein involved in propanediol utilization
LGARPVSDDVKLPVPPPLLVFVLNDIVGVGLVDQTTPRKVTVALPGAVTFPPLVAVVVAIALMADVVKIGTATTTVVLNDNSFPYAVPALLVA